LSSHFFRFLQFAADRLEDANGRFACTLRLRGVSGAVWSEATTLTEHELAEYEEENDGSEEAGDKSYSA
jgi:hypothetical protein